MAFFKFIDIDKFCKVLIVGLLRMIMAIIKTKSIYNVKNIHLIHHGYRTVASILRANSANKFCVF
jgi:hypothetical protein